jgi:hypothetical protein
MRWISLLEKNEPPPKIYKGWGVKGVYHNNVHVMVHVLPNDLEVAKLCSSE